MIWFFYQLPGTWLLSRTSWQPSLSASKTAAVTKYIFLLVFTSVLLGYLRSRAVGIQSIYCPLELAITSSAKRVACAAGSGLDQLIILGVTGSVARFLEVSAEGERCSGCGTSGWWVSSCASIHCSLAWVFSMWSLSCSAWW